MRGAKLQSPVVNTGWVRLFERNFVVTVSSFVSVELWNPYFHKSNICLVLMCCAYIYVLPFHSTTPDVAMTFSVIISVAGFVRHVCWHHSFLLSAKQLYQCPSSISQMSLTPTLLCPSLTPHWCCQLEKPWKKWQTQASWVLPQLCPVLCWEMMLWCRQVIRGFPDSSMPVMFEVIFPSHFVLHLAVFQLRMIV